MKISKTHHITKDGIVKKNPSKYPTQTDAFYEKTKALAQKEGVMFADTSRYFYTFDKFAGGDWTAKEIFDKKAESKKVFLGNKVKLHLGADDWDYYGTIVDFGYSRRAKRYFITVARVTFPPTVGFTGMQTFTKYYDRYSDAPVYRLKRKEK